MDYSVITYTVVTLAAIGIILAVILYFVARQFRVVEDPRIDEVEEVTPGANCGGCGYPGCRGFSEACVRASTLEGLFCPVGGNDCMARIAVILGLEASAQEPMLAVVRCNGTPEHRARINFYNGAPSCAIASSLYGGDTGCTYGCLGLADCVKVCNFDAISMDPRTGLPVVSEDKCTACGACVKACPRSIIELRFKGKKNRRIFISCMNRDKGAIARKSCAVACIACGKCEKACTFDAIITENNLAYIDFEKCKLCRKCVAGCPTYAIHELNFPPRKEATETIEEKATETAEKKAIENQEPMEQEPDIKPVSKVKSVAKPKKGKPDKTNENI
ncbi:MAG: Fe-S cluster domain-containing protein [Bacteroidota bacterium]